MDEITRRRAATVFTETNLKTFVYNVLALAAVYLVGNASGPPFTQLRRLYVFFVHVSLFSDTFRPS